MFPFEQLASGRQIKYCAPLLCVPVEQMLWRQAENNVAEERAEKNEIRKAVVSMQISLSNGPQFSW
jgi:hypothetical protein